MRLVTRFLTVLTIAASTMGPAMAHAALDCSAAVEVQLNASYTGDNTGLANNVTLYGCSDWDESGGEVVHHLHLDVPHYFAISLVCLCDLDLVILDACDENLGCLQVIDDDIVTTSPLVGDYFLVVDGFAGSSCAFELILEDRGVSNQALSFGQVKAVYGRVSPRVR